jgi:hypothetical protein
VNVLRLDQSLCFIGTPRGLMLKSAFCVGFIWFLKSDKPARRFPRHNEFTRWIHRSREIQRVNVRSQTSGVLRITFKRKKEFRTCGIEYWILNYPEQRMLHENKVSKQKLRQTEKSTDNQYRFFTKLYNPISKIAHRTSYIKNIRCPMCDVKCLILPVPHAKPYSTKILGLVNSKISFFLWSLFGF